MVLIFNNAATHMRVGEGYLLDNVSESKGRRIFCFHRAAVAGWVRIFLRDKTERRVIML